MVHKATWYGTVVAAKILKNTSDIALGDFRAEIEVLRKVRTQQQATTRPKYRGRCIWLLTLKIGEQIAFQHITT